MGVTYSRYQDQLNSFGFKNVLTKFFIEMIRQN